MNRPPKTSSGQILGIPASLVLDLFRSPELFQQMMARPDFKRWVMASKELVIEMMKDKTVNGLVKDFDDDLWSECWEVFFQQPQGSPPSPDALDTRQESNFGRYSEDSSVKLDATPFKTEVYSRSRDGKATTDVGEVKVPRKGELRMHAESELNSATSRLGNLSLTPDRPDGPQGSGKAAVTIGAKSTTGDANVQIQTLDLGDTIHGSDHRTRPVPPQPQLRVDGDRQESYHQNPAQAQNRMEGFSKPRPSEGSTHVERQTPATSTIETFLHSPQTSGAQTPLQARPQMDHPVGNPFQNPPVNYPQNPLEIRSRGPPKSAHQRPNLQVHQTPAQGVPPHNPPDKPYQIPPQKLHETQPQNYLPQMPRFGNPQNVPLKASQKSSKIASDQHHRAQPHPCGQARVSHNAQLDRGLLIGAKAEKNADVHVNKMDLQLEDSEQPMQFLAESRTGDANFRMGSITIRTSKPKSDVKNYTINKVVGSLYVENTMSSSVTGCEGANIRLTDTAVKQNSDM